MTKTIVSLVCMCICAFNMALELSSLVVPTMIPHPVGGSWAGVLISAAGILYFGAVIVTDK